MRKYTLFLGICLRIVFLCTAKIFQFQFDYMSKKITPYKDSSLSKKEQIAKMFDTKLIMLKSRPGERYASALTKISLNNQI